MIKKIKKLCRLLCISALIGILLLPGQVMADRGGNSCRVTLPVSVIYRNQNSADSRVFEYVLSAKESGVPIPQETELCITVSNGAGRGLFGAIEYTEPGEYHYEISQKSGSVKNIRYDQSPYEVTVYEVYGNLGVLIQYLCGFPVFLKVKNTVLPTVCLPFFQMVGNFTLSQPQKAPQLHPAFFLYCRHNVPL